MCLRILVGRVSCTTTGRSDTDEEQALAGGPQEVCVSQFPIYVS